MASMLDAWTVTVVRHRQTPAGVDQYGDPIPGQWLDEPLPDALFAPGGTSEPVQAGAAPVISTPTVYWPGRRVDIAAADRLVVDGTTWDIEGRPAHWPLGTAATLKTSEGK